MAQSKGGEVSISAASDLQFVLPELITLYDKSSLKFNLRFGASGILSTQIIRGLGTDIFLSADASQVEKVRLAGLAAADPFVYAHGHIAVAALRTSAIQLDNQLRSTRAFFSDELALNRMAKLAMANPLHAPYGLAAQQALETLGLLAFFKPHIVLGENVAQAAQFVASGSAVAGLIGLALCKAPAMSGILQFKELDQSLHKPIRQTAILVKHSNTYSEEASKFLLFLKSDKAKALLTQHGFSTNLT
jgi:molybdate transport system substrate-binding protein